jgi:hypothetical protein
MTFGLSTVSLDSASIAVILLHKKETFHESANFSVTEEIAID